MATDYIKTVQTRLTRKGTRLSKSQIREVYNQVVVAPLAPTEDELSSVTERLEEQFKVQTHEPNFNQITAPESTESVQQPANQQMTPVQPAAQSSNSNLVTSIPSAMSQATNVATGLTEQQIQSAVEQQFGKESVETKTAILNYVAQDTFSTAQELQTALGKLRQMKLDILMKLIADHNSQAVSDENLLKTALLNAAASRREETEVFFNGFETQLQQMRASFGI